MEALLDEVVEISDDDRNDYAFKESEYSDGNGARHSSFETISSGPSCVSRRASNTPPDASPQVRRQGDTGNNRERRGPVEINDAKAALLRGLVPNPPADGADKED